MWKVWIYVQWEILIMQARVLMIHDFLMTSESFEKEIWLRMQSRVVIFNFDESKHESKN